MVRKNCSIIFNTIKLTIDVNKKLFFVIIFFSIFSGIAPIISMLLSQKLLNSLQLASTTLKNIMMIFILYISFTILTSLINNISGYYTEKFQMTLSYRLNCMIMDKCSKLSLEHFEDAKIYNQISRLEREISYKPYQTMQSIISILSSLISLVLSIFIIFMWKPWLILLVTIMPSISILQFLKISQKEFEIKYEMSGKEREAWYISYLMTHDFSYKEINMLNIKDHLLKKFKILRKEFIRQQNSINRKKVIITSVFEFFQDIVISIVVFIAVLSAYYKEILIGSVTTYIRAISLIQANTSNIIQYINLIYNSNLYMDLFYNFMSIEEKQDDIGNIVNDINTIEFKNVSFGYKHGNKVLNNINFKISKGEKVAIIGKNGSGKSTILKLICGLYDVDEGQILINGIDLKEINRLEYKNKVSVLFQDYLKYEFTLEDNVVLGDILKEKNVSDIYSALKLSSVDFLKKEENEYLINSQLGNWFEDGVQLSGGQWQKVALARVYYRKRPLYLLDEPSSSLDPVAEINVFNTFYKLSDDSIGIFITHKVSATKNTNKIIVVDNGVIAGIGTNNQLMQNCKVFKELKEHENYDL